MNRRIRLFFTGLLFLLCVLRLGIILTSIERVSHYDELDLGTISRELDRGLKVPFEFFQLDAYSGESFILGPMVLPFAKLFGQNLFAIKMVPFFFSILMLGAGYAFMLRYFGTKSAIGTGLLFVFSPPGFVQLSLAAMAGHSEAFFFGFLALFCFYEFLFKQKSLVLLALFGALSGFAVWFYYANAIIVFSCLAVFFITDRKFFFKSLPLFFAAFLITFSPWIISNLRNDFLGLELVSENLAGFDWPRVIYTLKKPIRFFIMNLPLSFFTTPVFGIPKAFSSYVYYLLLLLLVLPVVFAQTKGLLERRIDGRFLFFLIYPLIYTACITFSHFDVDRDIGFVGYRYVTPMVSVLLLLGGVGYAFFENRRVFFYGLLLLGFAGQAGMLFQEPFARAFQYQGYSYYQLGTRWHFNLAWAFKNYEDFQQKTAHFSVNERRYILWGMAQMAQWNEQEMLFESRQKQGDDLKVYTMTAKEPEEYAPFSYEWLGGLPRFRPPEGLESFRQISETIPISSKKYFCQGWLWGTETSRSFIDCPDCYIGKDVCDIHQLDRVMVYLFDLYQDNGPRRMKQISRFGSEERKLAYRGVGHTLFLTENILNPLSKSPMPIYTGPIAKEDMAEVYWGVGWAIREKFREDRIRAMDWIDRLPAEAKDSAAKGLKDYDQWYMLN